MPLVSGNINSKAFLAGASSNLSRVAVLAEMYEFAVFPLPYLRTFQKLRRH